MGLISGLLTWPIAPVRGVVWVAQQIQQEAEREWYDPAVIQDQLDDLDQRRAAGLISEDEAAELEEQLVQRLLSGWGDG
ncbi:MAG TPA: c-type cytochrome biogenesis protein CcmI [Actinomycetales bacterium]|nr:c-type cytochrome biogenesis protein CcmI [Actinomycetales bacterium]